jgi:hypothetical protein
MKRKEKTEREAGAWIQKVLPLLDQVRRYADENTWVVRDSPCTAYGRRRDSSLEFGVREIERLRRRFPRDRVNHAWRILDSDGWSRADSRLRDDLREQVYRAHYSSLKIQRSWQRTLTATRAIAHLFDVPAEPPDGPPPSEDRDQELVRRVWTTIWPDEKLGDLLDLLRSERFYGRIPLRTGALVLGLRLLLDEYARGLVQVLRRLHRDDAYTYGLCLGRTLSWDEAMVFKALPEAVRGTGGDRPKGGADAQS